MQLFLLLHIFCIWKLFALKKTSSFFKTKYTNLLCLINYEPIFHIHCSLQCCHHTTCVAILSIVCPFYFIYVPSVQKLPYNHLCLLATLTLLWKVIVTSAVKCKLDLNGFRRRMKSKEDQSLITSQKNIVVFTFSTSFCALGIKMGRPQHKHFMIG